MNPKLYLRIFCILSSMCILVTGHTAETESSRYRMIGQQEGLSDNKVQSILKDSLGTCWVGTARGLDRIYEGRVFNYNEDRQLRNKSITFVTQDKKNNIWVSANGLYLYDYVTDSFQEMKADGFSIKPVWYSDTADGLVFCSSEGIARFRYSDDSLEMLIPRKWSESRYNGFCMVSDSTAFVSSIDGVFYRISLNTGESKEIHRFQDKVYTKAAIADNLGRALR